MESAFRDARDVVLIETLGWTGTDLPRVALHLDRLEASARRMGRPCDRAAVEATLRSRAPATPARMRVTLDHAGRVVVEAQPMPPSAATWRVGLSEVRLRSDDPWLTLKSSRRAAYDAARQAMAGEEAILANERGELCDGTITTLFVREGCDLLTPPLTSGLLPGILRAELIASGSCREAVLRPEDLTGRKVFVGNSLRGLIGAIWAG